MDDDGKKEGDRSEQNDEKSKSEEDDVIPSSQDEVFSSQSTTPDIVATPSELLAMMQPSDIISSANKTSDAPAHSMSRALIPSTPGTSVGRVPSLVPSPVAADTSLTPHGQDMFASTPHQAPVSAAKTTPSEIRLDVSTSPSIYDISDDARMVKRPLSSAEDSGSPQLKRPRTDAAAAADAAADDSDVQILDVTPQEWGSGPGGFVRECPVVTLTPDQPRESGDRPSATESQDMCGTGLGANSQAGFSLRYSQSDTDAETQVMADVTVEPPTQLMVSQEEHRSHAEPQHIYGSLATTAGESEDPGRLTIDTQCGTSARELSSAQAPPPSGFDVTGSSSSEPQAKSAASSDDSTLQSGAESEFKRPLSDVAESQSNGTTARDEREQPELGDMSQVSPVERQSSERKEDGTLLEAGVSSTIAMEEKEGTEEQRNDRHTIEGKQTISDKKGSNEGNTSTRYPDAKHQIDKDEEHSAQEERLSSGARTDPSSAFTSNKSPSKSWSEHLSNGKTPPASQDPAAATTASPESPEDVYVFHGTQSELPAPCVPVRPPSSVRELLQRLQHGFALEELQSHDINKETIQVEKTLLRDIVNYLVELQSQLHSMSTTSASTSTSTLSTSGRTASTLGSGYGGDRSTSISSGSFENKRLSTVTLSTIDGRGARQSIGSSVEADARLLGLHRPAGAARGRPRESLASVQTVESPGSVGSDVEILPSVPEFTSPYGLPPRPHGQPAAISSLLSPPANLSSTQSDFNQTQLRQELAHVISGLESPPTASSTQLEVAKGGASGAAQLAAVAEEGRVFLDSGELPESGAGRASRGRGRGRGGRSKKVTFSRLSRRGRGRGSRPGSSASGEVAPGADADQRLDGAADDAAARSPDAAHVPQNTPPLAADRHADAAAPSPSKPPAGAPSPEKHSSEETHVTNTTSRSSGGSPEIPRLLTPEPQLAAGGGGAEATGAARILSEEEEAQLSDREMTSLRSGALQPDQQCFALWVDKSFYPARLISPHSGDARWNVLFDDSRKKLVSEANILPVAVLWKGLSVFVQREDLEGLYYETAIITGHRLACTKDGAYEYIVSLDSSSVTCAVPRSRLLLSRDQAAILMESRPAAVLPAAIGSPGRALSLDNVLSGRRQRASAGRGGGGAVTAAVTPLPGFETSAGQTSADDSTAAAAASTSTGRSRAKRGSSSGTPRRRSSRSTGTPAPEPPGSAEPAQELTEGATPSRSARSRGSRVAKSILGLDSELTPAASPRRAGRAKSTGTPSARGDATPSDATPTGRRRKRPAASTPEDPTAAKQAPASSGRRRKRSSATATAASAAPLSPSMVEQIAMACTHTADKPDTSLRQKGKGRSRRPSKSMVAAAAAVACDASTEDELALPLADFPLTKSDLFKGMSILLTCAGGSVASGHAAAELRRLPPYNKAHVTEHIECRGGHVSVNVDLTVDDVLRMRGRSNSREDMVLLSNGPLTTAKYITCLAMGVPCVTVSWLVQSISKGVRQPIEDFLLPAGVVPGEHQAWEQVPRAPPPLQATRVLVAEPADSVWAQTITTIVTAAGAEVKCDDQDPNDAVLPFLADVVVAPPICPRAVLEWARVLDIPVVSTQWAIGCVISHQKLAATRRPEFAHDYKYV